MRTILEEVASWWLGPCYAEVPSDQGVAVMVAMASRCVRVQEKLAGSQWRQMCPQGAGG